VSLIIPSFGRSRKLQNLVDSVAEQILPSGWIIETIIVIDGEGDPALCDASINPSTITIEHAGAAAARNEGIKHSCGEILIFLNNDVTLTQGFIAAHITAISDGHQAVLGCSPWKAASDPTLFDAFVTHTSAIFDQSSLVHGTLRDFRSAWTLNLSIARSVIDRDDELFCERIRPVYYEDLEFAYRCLGDAPSIYYEQDAVAIHDHRVTIVDYIEREVLLGMMSAVLSGENPECFRALFPMDPRQHADAVRAQLAVDVSDHTRLLRMFIEQSEQRVDSIDEHRGSARRLYVAHLPIKRRAFRLGLIAQLDRAVAWRDRVGEAQRIVRTDPVFAQLASVKTGAQKTPDAMSTGR
jgi:glycosyltransferase involved in cell wall biosynthesis